MRHFCFQCAWALTLVVLLSPNALTQSRVNHKQFVRMKAAPGGRVLVTPQSQTVIIKMTGDPVAVVRSRMPGKVISDFERESIARDLSSRQDALVPSVEATGAKVLGKFQHAINGIKVRATREQIAKLSLLPGVVAVKPVMTYHLDNAESVPFIGTPSVWQGPPGLHGENIKVAVIDTGIDYTHANFGGPGTAAAFKAAAATSAQPGDPRLFGPNAPKVKGGIDLVGDNYDASSPDPAYNTPHPDPNPLDCAGHGSHVAGTLAGFGVTSSGATFHGSYDTATPATRFTIGPGVAPLADLYAVRVFGCAEGAAATSDVILDAIDWAVANDMQVINMSLGAPFGTEDAADAEAAENAVNAGIVVVASAGNDFAFNFYITSAPSTGDKVISVGAIDSRASFPGVNMDFAPSGSIVAELLDGVPVRDGTQLPIYFLPDPVFGISGGCDPSDYIGQNVNGKLVVTEEWGCDYAAAIFGQQAGAAAIAIFNPYTGYPTLEGPINSNPATGIPYIVTIPSLGIQGGLSLDGSLLAAASSAILSNTTIANPPFRKQAFFSSGGPRAGDGHLKPDLSAPGVGIYSTAIGTGTESTWNSGTSMAAPHVAGTAALAVQAHPHWDAGKIAAAIINTADMTQVLTFPNVQAPGVGNGLVQPAGATRTSVIARAEDGTASLSFGIKEFTTSEFTVTGDIRVQNLGDGYASFSVSVVKNPGAVFAPHSISVSPMSLTLPGHESRLLRVSLTVSGVALYLDSFNEVLGRIVLTPETGRDGVTLSVPYYMVVYPRSNVQGYLQGNLTEHDSATVQLTNRSSVLGTADFYAWGLSGHHESLGSVGIRAVGVQTWNVDPSVLWFAVNTFAPVPNPISQVYEIFVLDSTGTPIYDIVTGDFGILFNVGIPFYSGALVTEVINLQTEFNVLEYYYQPSYLNDSNTILIPISMSDAGITSSNPRFTYQVQITDLASGARDITNGTASFNAFDNAISTSQFAVLGAGQSATVPISIDRTEFAQTPVLGEMVVFTENRRGNGHANAQALLLPVRSD